jgi:hypothetical protein
MEMRNLGWRRRKQALGSYSVYLFVRFEVAVRSQH